MTHRINPFQSGAKSLKALFGLGANLSRSGIEQSLLELINFRVSQLNGCAYCLDMHSKDLRVEGETEQRLYLVAVRHETSLFTDRELAALDYAEAATVLSAHGIADEVYEKAASHFPGDDMVDLCLAVATINTFNRLNITFRTPAGSYQPGQHAALQSN